MSKAERRREAIARIMAGSEERPSPVLSPLARRRLLTCLACPTWTAPKCSRYGGSPCGFRNFLRKPMACCPEEKWLPEKEEE